jgi:15-cis-phytoene synthase
MIDFQRLDDPLVLPLVPVARRAAVVTLWKLDARLAEMARAGKEMALRQIRLKWWEEQLAALSVEARPPEPLLGEVAANLVADLAGERLAELAVAWAQVAVADAGELPVGHGAVLFGLTAAVLGAPQDGALAKAGEGWARVEALLADAAGLAAVTSEGVTSEDARWGEAAAALATVRLAELPRALAAITGVARRIARRRGVRSAGAEQWVLFRVGLFGR